MFLLTNGLRLPLSPDDFTRAVLDVATGTLSKDDLAGLLGRHVVPHP
ncbi:MAG TPA: hypothetical protein VF796_11230 [Humisphaera sp.]